MKKKILWIPFLSLQDKATLKFNLDADQNFRFLLGLNEHLKKHFDITYLMPYINTTFDKSSSLHYFNLLGKNNIIHYLFSNSNIGQRYDFQYKEFVDILVGLKPDIIFNNCDTISKNLKSIIDMMQLKTKVFTYFHFLDIPEFNMIPSASSYFLRQVESALISDALGFSTQMNIDLFKQSAKKHFNIDIQTESDFYEFVFSDKIMIEELKSIDVIPKKNKWVVFPNRLSSNNYSHHQEFINAVNNLYKRRKDFSVILTNPTGYINNDILEKEVKPIIFPFGKKLLTRHEYLSILCSSDYVCALFKELHGGFAVREAIYCECVPIVPDLNEYARFKQLYYSDVPQFTYINKTLHNLEQTIDQWLDIDVQKSYLENAKKRLIETSSIESNYEKLHETLGAL